MGFTSAAVLLVWASVGVFALILGLIGLRVTARGLRESQAGRVVGREHAARPAGRMSASDVVR